MGDDNIIPFRRPTIIGEAGGLVDRASVTLGIHGETLDPEEISALLSCKPTTSHRRGDQRGHNAPPWPKGAWLLSVDGEAPTEPEELLRALLARLPDDPSVWTGLRQRFSLRLGFGLFLDAWNRGFELSPTALERVARMGAPLGFDIYAQVHEGDG